MPERKVEPGKQPIEIGNIQAEAQRVSEQASGLLAQLRKNHVGNQFTGLNAILMGSDQKQTQGPNGEIVETDWTWDDMIDKFSQGLEEDDRSTREAMKEEFELITSAHHLLTRSPNQELAGRSAEVIDFTTALLRRYMVAPGDLSYSYPLTYTASFEEAELLEVVRRTVLRPSYVLHEGMGRSGFHGFEGYDEDSFWEELKETWGQIEQRMTIKDRNDPRYHDEFVRHQRSMIEENLELYTEADWQQLTQLEDSFFLQYLKSLTRRTARDNARVADFYERLTNNGERVATDEQIEALKGMAERAKGEAEAVSALKSFDQVKPWIKERFGEDATYLTFLQRHHEVDLVVEG